MMEIKLNINFPKTRLKSTYFTLNLTCFFVHFMFVKRTIAVLCRTVRTSVKKGDNNYRKGGPPLTKFWGCFNIGGLQPVHTMRNGSFSGDRFFILNAVLRILFMFKAI